MLYTTPTPASATSTELFIRISKILLYAIHNFDEDANCLAIVVYQDFKDTFVCYTQRVSLYCCMPRSCLSGFQRYFCMLYTTLSDNGSGKTLLFIRISKILLYAIHNYSISYILQMGVVYQDFKDTFVCYTQPCTASS